MIITVSMPKEAADKIKSDPEAFIRFMIANGFPVLDVRTSEEKHPNDCCCSYCTMPDLHREGGDK